MLDSAFNRACVSICALTSLLSTELGAQGPNDRYYRFEEGIVGNAAIGAGRIVDSLWNSPDGTPSGNPLYSADVPMTVIPQTGAANHLSLDFNGGQSILFASLFLLHRGFGDATLEFFQKGPNNGNEDVFWTRPTTDPDANRFNIFNYRGQFSVDYREPNGTLRGTNPTPVAHNEWTHVAIVKDTVSAAPSHQYRIYLDGVLRTTTDFSGSFIEPDPLQQWTISGRNGYEITGLVDEVRLVQRALTPSEFLISVRPVYTPFASGCAGSAGIASNTATALPRIGQTMIATFGNLPPPNAVFFLLGTSRTTSALGPLPLDLTVIGAPGCALAVSNDVIVTLLGSAGSASVSLPIPNDQMFLGFQFFTQGLVFDPGWNPLAAVMSVACEATVGN